MGVLKYFLKIMCVHVPITSLHARNDRVPSTMVAGGKLLSYRGKSSGCTKLELALTFPLSFTDRCAPCEKVNPIKLHIGGQQ